MKFRVFFFCQMVQEGIPRICIFRGMVQNEITQFQVFFSSTKEFGAKFHAFFVFRRMAHSMKQV
jgi:hypothetical protein